ncbi:hypothetical protein [Colwellia sp. 20A7]|uniref:hypothetical protein n=1 Tax=Colwellia sp. 20A7 TaxID=2689569 RepID=UPI001916A0D5|nr:hypothetical protein [Colwellia sp. 20A7]
MNFETPDDFIARIEKDQQVNTFFLTQNLGAEVHWFFHEALKALKSELYLSACSSFVIGIEASIRFTQAQLESNEIVNKLDPIKTLSNRLLKVAKENGLPIEKLAFPSETDFNGKLLSTKPDLVNVEIVRLRHHLCHGNILEFRNSELGDSDILFTPECVRDLAYDLYQLSKNWVSALAEFRSQKFGISPYILKMQVVKSQSDLPPALTNTKPESD